MRTSSSLAPLLSALALAVAVAAHAAPDEATKKRAHEAFERGTKQSERGDYEAAARSYAEADELSPNKVALEAALDTCILANDAPLGAELLERSKRDSTLSADLLKRAHAAFDGRAGRVEIKCVDACVAKIDGAVIEQGGTWAKVGPHHVSIKEGEYTLDKDVDVKSGAPLTLEVDRTPKPITPVTPPIDTPKPSTRILHPAFAYTGIGITAGLLAGTIASGVDATNDYDAFVAATPAQKDALAEAGRASEKRTNVLIGVTAGMGAITLGLGLLAIPWGGSGDSAKPVSFEIGPGRLQLSGSF